MYIKGFVTWVSCHHVIRSRKRLRDSGLRNDMKETPHVIRGPFDVTELEFDYYFEIARQWDEEDLTAPPHRPYGWEMPSVKKKGKKKAKKFPYTKAGKKAAKAYAKK